MTAPSPEWTSHPSTTPKTYHKPSPESFCHRLAQIPHPQRQDVLVMFIWEMWATTVLHRYSWPTCITAALRGQLSGVRFLSRSLHWLVLGLQMPVKHPQIPPCWKSDSVSPKLNHPMVFPQHLLFLQLPAHIGLWSLGTKGKPAEEPNIARQHVRSTDGPQCEVLLEHHPETYSLTLAECGKEDHCHGVLQ